VASQVKKGIAISLLIALLISSFGQSIIFCHYLLNKNYYATVLCINREKPKMHCEGKCHLKKELKEQEKKEESPATPTKDKQETNQFFQSNPQITFFPIDVIDQFDTFYLLLKSQDVFTTVFHPPAL
jgi:hypothetical protein